EVCKQRLAPQLLPAEPRRLTHSEIDGLWRIFVAIGQVWKNTFYESAGLKSSWLEFVTLRTTIRPSYVAEYGNALQGVAELVSLYPDDAFETLFLDSHRKVDDHGLPLDKPLAKDRAGMKLDTRLAHAKHFVVDEFIRVQVVAGGFRNFIRPSEPEIRPEN